MEKQDNVGLHQYGAANGSNSNVMQQSPQMNQQNGIGVTHNKETKKSKLFCHCNPPDGLLGHFLYLAIVFILVWGAGAVVTGYNFLPGGTLFGIGIVGVGCWTGAQLVAAIGLPQLFGILAVGFGLRNIPYINVAADIDPEWHACVRTVSIAMVLTRAGLTLNMIHLKKHKWATLRLGILPNLIEAAVNTVISHFLMELPWLFAVMLGFLTTAVSMVIVIPCMVVIQDQGLGEDKGVATLAMSAGGIDNIVTAIGFGIAFNVAYSDESQALQVLHPICDVLLGVVAGILFGCISWYLPSKSQNGIAYMRVIYLLFASTIIAYAGKEMGYVGCGALGTIVISFVAAQGWRRTDDKLEGVIKAYNVLVAIFKPLLLGLIGAQFPIEDIDAKTAGLAMATVAIGLFIRMLCATLVVYGVDLNFSERIFIAVTWIPKVTFEAAIAYTAWDAARENQSDEEAKYGSKILITAVMCIMVTGPIGLGCIQRLAPKLLSKIHRVNTEISLVQFQTIDSV